ncbi:MAG: hypothetical protein HZB56_12435 [Deltaproteobacteria bacterium]|nr:hypothetical protein [Deltaproteobacteria bacterium]
MARGRSGPVRRPRRGALPPVPFLLATARPAAPEARQALARQARLLRLAATWQALAPLEEAAWRGGLSARGLARLQRARVAYARLVAEVGR